MKGNLNPFALAVSGTVSPHFFSPPTLFSLPELPLLESILGLGSRCEPGPSLPASYAAVLEQGLFAIRPPSLRAVGVGLGSVTVLLVAA